MFTLSTVNCTWLTERLLYRRYLCIKFVYYQLVLSRFKHCSLKLSHVFVCFFVMHFPPKETCRSIVCHTPAVRDTTSLSLNHTVVESCRLFAFNICYLRWSTNRPSRPLHTLHAQFSDKTVVQHNIVCFSPVRVYQACKQSFHIHTVQRWEIPWTIVKSTIPLFGMNGFVYHMNGFVHYHNSYMILYIIAWLCIPSIIIHGFVYHSIYYCTWFCIPLYTWCCIPPFVIHGFVYHRWL